jgi:hypothetical protein
MRDKYNGKYNFCRSTYAATLQNGLPVHFSRKDTFQGLSYLLQVIPNRVQRRLSELIKTELCVRAIESF